jgi:hypothetical protein
MAPLPGTPDRSGVTGARELTVAPADPQRAGDTRWLFPGCIHGQPLDLHSLLNRDGISARPARNGALAALASDLPAAVLADFLGIHVNTAVRWVTYARQGWTAYLAARDADLAFLSRQSEGVRLTGTPELPVNRLGDFASSVRYHPRWREGALLSARLFLSSSQRPRQSRYF